MGFPASTPPSITGGGALGSPGHDLTVGLSVGQERGQRAAQGEGAASFLLFPWPGLSKWTRSARRQHWGQSPGRVRGKHHGHHPLLDPRSREPAPRTEGCPPGPHQQPAPRAEPCQWSRTQRTWASAGSALSQALGSLHVPHTHLLRQPSGSKGTQATRQSHKIKCFSV